MHIEFLLEEDSARAALQNLVPKIVGSGITGNFHVHQGKKDLLKSLPGRLKGYSRWLPEDWRIVILLDEDRQDCQTIKAALEKAARDAGLFTRSRRSPQGRFRVVNRVAIEELEAWFFGDVDAIAEAYPRVPRNLSSKARFRDPDAIRGGTWEALQRVLQKAGYYRTGMPKIEAAERIAKHMDPCRNKSKSFQVFRDALAALATQTQTDTPQNA